MNARDRFRETMRFGNPDRVPYWEIIGYWQETIERWQNEGLPPDVHVREFFGLDRYERVPINLNLVPPFKEEVLEEKGNIRTIRDSSGIVKQVVRDGLQTIPHYISFPVKNRDDFAEFRKRLNPDSPCRLPAYWEDYKRCVAGRDYPLGVHAGSLFGWIRNWMGFETAALTLHDDPVLIEEMMDCITELVLKVTGKVVEEIPDIDYAIFWEDMCYKSGSIISPDHFRRFMVPRYRKITDMLRKHGIDVILVDCDGYIDELIPLWLEGGLTGVYPLEVAAGEDPVRLRREYGKDLLLVGGIDKRALAGSREDVEREVYGKVPFLIESGGWIPSVDHAVPPDVPYDNYRYYLELLRRIAEKG